MLKELSNPRQPHPQQRQLTGPAGSISILNIHCLHSAVINASDEPRHALFANFSRRDSPLLLMNPTPAVSSETLARHPEEIRALLVE